MIPIVQSSNVESPDNDGRGNSRTSILEDKYVETMQDLLPGVTNANLSELFGVGYHTWVKIRSRKPIRASVAERIRAQLERECASAMSCLAARGNANAGRNLKMSGTAK